MKDFLNAQIHQRVSVFRKTHTMKKHNSPKNSISLGDLVATVSSYARNEREVVVAIGDLFRKGNVVAKTRYGSKRLKLA
jgi:hypothetical protein